MRNCIFLGPSLFLCVVQVNCSGTRKHPQRCRMCRCNTEVNLKEPRVQRYSTFVSLINMIYDLISSCSAFTSSARPLLRLSRAFSSSVCSHTYVAPTRSITRPPSLIKTSWNCCFGYTSASSAGEIVSFSSRMFEFLA